MSRRGHSQLPVEERMRVVLAVLSGELTIAEAARRHGTTGKTVGEWRDRFLEAGQAGLENMMPGPTGRNGNSTERRQRAEIEQPWPAPRVDAIEALAAKYAADWPAWGHRLRIWRLGAEHVHEVPSKTSRP